MVTTHRKKYSFIPAAALLTFVWTGAALSATSDAFDVTITLQNSCDLSTVPTDMNFGTQGLLDQDYDATSAIYVTCTTGASYDLELDEGGNADGSTRRMTDGNSNYVSYRLYSDSGHTTLWGDGTTFGDAYADTGTGSEETVTVYGRVLESDNSTTPPAGTYTDTVTVTVTF
ncbi:MAG: spore coat U domain-containing protein [Porticoccaceae bacterium]|nr:spore coat U domain-containing protein [Porticoccaceae bacterium]